MSLRAFGFLLGDSSGGGGTFATDIDLVLTGIGNDLTQDDQSNFEVLIDNDGNILLGL